MRALVVVAHGLSCSAAGGSSLDQGSSPVSPALAGEFLPAESPGKPYIKFLSVSGNSFCQSLFHLLV